MDKDVHVLTFLLRVKKFAHSHGITSMMRVDADNLVDDVMEPAETTGGLIADMENDLGECLDRLTEYYRETNNKAALKRIDKINNWKP